MAASVIGALQVRLEASDASFTSGVKRARASLRGLRASAQNWTQAGLALGGFSAALGGLAVAAGRASMALNKGMANVATLIPENTARVAELKTAVQDLAVAHGRDSQDLTAGLYQTISAFGDQAGRTMEILRINSEAAAAGVATTEDAIALTSAVTKAYGASSGGRPLEPEVAAGGRHAPGTGARTRSFERSPGGKPPPRPNVPRRRATG